MKIVKVYGYTYKALQLVDFTPGFWIKIEAAGNEWRARCDEFLAANGDLGSHVLGAGIAVDYLWSGDRIPKRRIVLEPPTNSQGSLVWESSVKEIVAQLNDVGVPAYYLHGHMD